MQNLFGVNVKTGELTSDKFTVRRVSQETAARQDESTAEMTKADKYAAAPWLSIIMYLTFWFAVTVFCSFINALLKEIPLEQVLYNSRILLPIAGVCLVAAIAIFIFKRIRFNTTVNSSGYQQLKAKSEKLFNMGYEELNIPYAADSIDVFMNEYKIDKNGKKKITNMAICNAVDSKIFTENDCLCIADCQRVIAVPLSSITGFYRVNKRITFANWTKPEPPTSPKYKPYKILLRNGFYSVKPYYSLRLNSYGEEYEIIVPPYELETMQKYVNTPIL